MTLNELITKRDKLRELWAKETEPNRKHVYVIQGKCLNIAIKRQMKKQKILSEDELYKVTKEIFG